MRLPTILFFVLISVLVFITKAFAWDSSSAYNTIAMSYTANTTITQIINLNSTQQATTTINFEVDVKNGGGRPTHDLNGNPLQYSTQTDTASITIYRYNSAGQLLGSTVSQNYILYNYGSNAGWSAAPGDNQHPFTNASVTYTGDLSQVAYIKIEMKGTDGAWWAGNYGAQWRTPTVTIGSNTTNIVYNAEFGVAPNGVQAQGWTPSYGSWSACGVTSGNNTCVTQQSGVTANMWGGGYDVNGGTTSGTSGGYSGTLTSDNALQAAAGTITVGGGGTATPTVTGTSTTYTYRSVATSPGVTSVYKTPVTTTTYSDGTSTTSNGTEVLHQTKVASTVTTNTISGTTLTTINTPINTVTPADGGSTFIEANGTATSTSQTIQRGLNFQVWRYDPKNYNCGWLGCVWNFTYRTPSTNIADYGNTVNSGVTSNGMFIATNSDLPNNDNSWFGSNDGTVIRYSGTITAPITSSKPAGTVYRLYFYNNTDDGFVLRINGNTVINQNETVRYQAIFGYTSSGWIDVVAGQTYNIEAWYWNTEGGFGNTFYWDYGAGLRTIPNSAFTTGTIPTYTVDTTGVVYSNSSVVNITGSTVNLGPVVEGGTITMTNGTGQEVINSGAGSVMITPQQQGRIDNWNNGSGQNSNNHLYIDQISGNANTVNVTQTTTSTGKNRIEATISGSGGNNIDLTQTGSNYLKLDVNGAFNNITSQQSNNNTSNNYKETTITGSNNIINTNQKDNANKIMFNSINGSNNSITAVQEGSGSHYLENMLTGNGHSVIVNQSGNTSNSAKIDLSNSGGPASVDLQQSGGKSFTIIQGCSNPSGCTTVVRQ